MTYRVIIAGGRDFHNSAFIFETLDSFLQPISHNIEKIMHGGAAGVDCIAGMYAQYRGYDVQIFRADWRQYGPAAGPIRNKQMAQEGNFLIAFWNGESKGTKNMIEEATKAKIEKLVIRI